MRIFYHDDPDGCCSAFLIRHFRIDAYGDEDATYVPMQYDKKINLDAISPDEEVWIVDFSFEIPDMEKILEKTSNVDWIDHHKSAIDKYADSEELSNLPGLREPDGPAGCELTWRHLYGDEPVPDFVKYIGDKDTWTFKYGDETRNFSAGILAEDIHPSSEIWYHFWYSPQEVIQEGKIIQKFRDQTESKYIEENAFDVDWEGFNWCALNTSTKGSEFLEKYKPDYDGYLTFRYHDGFWDIGLYTEGDNIDVSEIAEKFEFNGRRGGGHAGSAGFQCAFPPFLSFPSTD